MKKFLAIVMFAVVFTAAASAQDYNNAIGLRGGLYNGITFKHFMGSKTAVELIGSTRWSGIEITGLYEIHNIAFDVDRLNWYYGIGAHVGFYNGDNTSWGTVGTGYTVVGVDGILGIEYNFTELPINISLDWKPAFNFIGYTHFWPDGGALSIRYIW
jgi:opacity protein-like surface antigen